MKKAFLFLYLIMFGFSFANAQTATPPSGTGTSTDPYLIASLDNLYWVTQNTSSWASGKYFKQTADIDASFTSTWASGAGFTPIGNVTTPFAGNYNGQGFSISGLFINRTSTDGVGFFGVIAGAITIQNIRLVNINIKGKGNVGGLIGSKWDASNNNSTISNCSTTGTVIGAGDSVGGMFGCLGNSAAININRCFSTCTVSTTSTSGKYYGGMAGYVKGYSPTYQVKFSNCYASGAVSGNSATGGFIGWVNKTSGTGSWSTTYCYSTGKVSIYGTSAGDFGGFIGKYEDTAGTVTNCFWNTETSEQTIGPVGIGKTTAEMKTQSTYTSWDFVDETTNGSGDYWGITPGLNSGYPILTWQSPITKTATDVTKVSFTANWGAIPTANWSVAPTIAYKLDVATDAAFTTILAGYNNLSVSGTNQAVSGLTAGTSYYYRVRYTYNGLSTSANSNTTSLYPIMISDAAGLAAINNNLAGSYMLSADIVLTSAWTPLEEFTGTLDGNGHIISGLNINSSTTDNQGLFYKINGGAVRNLGIENASIVAPRVVGAIASVLTGATGLIEKCYVSNSYIEGYDHVGSLVGDLEGGAKIQDCYSAANVYSRAYQAGGIAGIINGDNSTIANCYFSGIVRCANQNRPAGIVPWRDLGTPTVKNCVNLAPFILGLDGRRVVGRDVSITMSGLYSLSSSRLSEYVNDYEGALVLPITASPYGATSSNGENIPLGDQRALTSDFYSTILTWNFNVATAVWKMLPTGGYPVLQWQPTLQTLTVFSAKDSITTQTTVDLDNLVILNNANNVFEFTTTNTNVTIDGNNNLIFSGSITNIQTAIITLTPKTNFKFTTSPNTSFFVTYVPPSIDTIEISMVEELQLIEKYPTKNFKLMADLDMTGVSFDGFCSVATPFTGTFNGNGHVIRNINYDNPTGSAPVIGFFCATDGATIRNLGIEKANIKAHIDVAAIIGSMKGGLMEKCYVADSYIEGHDHVGSLAGKIYGGALIQNCYSSATIKSREFQAGGLGGVIQDANSKISKCYFSGTVATPVDYLRSGGIVALVDNAAGITIEYCVNLATSIYSADPHYRIVDTQGQACTLTSNYSISTTKKNVGGTLFTDGTLNSENGKNLTSDAAALSSLFYTNTQGWNFDDVWTINEGQEYPKLLVFLPIATIKSNATQLIGNVSIGEESGKYLLMNKNTFQAAITSATTDAAKQTLNTAQKTFLSSINQTFTGTGSWSESPKWSAGFLPASTANVFVSVASYLTIGQAVNAIKLTVNPTAKLTLSETKSLNLQNLEIKSDATGTGTFIDNGTTTVAQAAIVNQYLTYRSWYLSSPVSGAYTLGGTDLIKYYNEPNNTWISSATLTSGKGYIVNPTNDEDESVVFAGTLNNGNQTIALTKTAEVAKTGFNLIGNPYPSYLNWTNVYTANSAVLSTSTMWYRTKESGVYYFWTVNGVSGVGTPVTASQYIPPMQAFWVRASTAGNLQMTNAMREHAPATNKLLKVKSANVSERVLLRLKAINGIYTDETVIYFDENAADAYDSYDSPKMSNDNAVIPEIYSKINAEDLAINGMNQIVADREIDIVIDGGSEPQSELSITGLENIPTVYSVVLKDKLLNTQTVLDADNSTYSFDVVSDQTDRFSLVFKSKGAVTDLKNVKDNISVYATNFGRIVINNASLGNEVSVYNQMGQKVYIQKTNAANCTLDKVFTEGIYFVRVAGSLGHKVVVRN